MSADPTATPPAGPPTQRLAVGSPSGIPVAAWCWSSERAGAWNAIVVGRMTLRLEGDGWIRAERQAPLPPEPFDLARLAAVVEPRAHVVVPGSEVGALDLGPLDLDATLVLEGRSFEAPTRRTRIEIGRPTLLVTGPAGTQRHAMAASACRLDASRTLLTLDLRVSLHGVGAPTARMLLALDDDRELEYAEERTLPTPGRIAPSALPFQGAPPAEPQPHSTQGRASTGLPFQESAAAPGTASSAVPAARPGQKRTLSLDGDAAAAPPRSAEAPAWPPAGGSDPWAAVAPPRVEAPRAPLAPPPPPPAPPPPAPVPSSPIAPPAVAFVAPQAPAGALEASNRASGAMTSGVHPPGVAARRGTAPAPREGLELLWFDPAAGERLRSRPDWRRLLRAAESRDVDPYDRAEEPTASTETRRAALEILLDADLEPLDAWPTRLAEAIGPRGRFTAPLVASAAYLSLDFDERAALRAWCAAARAHAGADPALEEVVRSGAALASDPEPMIPTSDFEEARAGLRVAFSARDRGLSPVSLDERAAQTLVAQRGFKSVVVKGEPCVRGRLLAEPTAAGGVVLYLPAACASLLPLSRVLAVRLLVEIVHPQEPGLGHDLAARAIAIARILTPTRKDT